LAKDLLHANDDLLWKAFQAGDESAFAQLYERFMPGLYSYGMKIARDEAVVRDCIQDLFISIWNSRQNLSKVRSIRYYLNSSLRRELVRRIRRSQPFSQELPDSYDFQVTLDAESLQVLEDMSQQQIGQLNEAVQQLPARQKEALYLRYYENFSYEEIADIMNISPGVAYNFVYRALLSLKKYLLASGLLSLLLSL
jgi:RNA polymerase sigma-70 factor (ECF subfamily)